MNTNKQLNRTTDEKGATFAKFFFKGKQSQLTDVQASDLLNYVKRLATGHAYKRYYYGDLSNPPQADYIDDLTQAATVALFDGKTTRYKKLTRGAVAAVTTLSDCKTTVDKATKKEKPLTDVQAFRRFIYLAFNDYNYNERSTTATIGKRQSIPLELTADSNTDELLYITDMIDFVMWTEKELNGLHAMHLTQDEINVINLVFSEKLSEREYSFIQYCYKHPCETRKNNARTFNREKGGTPFNSYNLFELKLKPALKKELKRQGIKRGLLIDLLNN